MGTFTIFGHTGFIGSHLKKKLRKHKLILPKRGKFKFKKSLHNIIYCIGSDNWMHDSYNSFKANLGYIPEIINFNKFTSFTFLSTTRIYKKNNITSENSYIKVNTENLDDYYNIKKLCAESYLLNQKQKINIIRLSNIYGDNYDAPLVLPRLLTNSINTGKITLTINKNSTKDFLNIDDATDIIKKISLYGKGGIYNVASGKSYKLVNIAKLIQRYTSCKIILKNQNRLIKEPRINIKKIEKEFGFKIKSNLLGDLKDLIQKYQIYYENKL